MIILDDRILGGKAPLTDKERLQGRSNQLWVTEFPSGLSARCHYSSENGFGIEEVSATMGGTIRYLRRHLDDFLSDEYVALEEDEKLLLQLEITEKLNKHFDGTGEHFTEEELECFFSEGFLGVLKMRVPEIEQNEVFNFYFMANKAIQNLEEKFVGRPYSEVLAEIESHLDNREAEDYKMWKAVQLNYNVIGWEHGRRVEYVDFLKMQSEDKNKKTQQANIDTQINILLEEWNCKSLKDFFDSYGLDGLKDINDLMRFCSAEATVDYKPIGNGSPLDAVMKLYFELKPYFENEHTAEEIGAGVKGKVTSKETENMLSTITGNGNEEKPEHGDEIIGQ